MPSDRRVDLVQSDFIQELLEPRQMAVTLDVLESIVYGVAQPLVRGFRKVQQIFF